MHDNCTTNNKLACSKGHTKPKSYQLREKFCIERVKNASIHSKAHNPPAPWVAGTEELAGN
jgi:hypothetical protein